MVGYPREGEAFGDYQVDGILGRGGMGVVYAATHRRIKRRVALKVITPELAGTDEYHDRFLNEAETLVRLDSPHIIQVLDHGEVDGALFIATQLVHGADLAERLDGGSLAVGAALSLAVQISSGLADAHRAGVLHRDIKPSNVLVTGPNDAPFAYLCDFGIARDTEPDRGLTMTGTVLGTFPYLAPERFGGAPAAVTADIYALGCLLWATLTGAAPYDGTQFQLAQAHVEAPVRQLQSAPGQPWIEDLNGVLAQAMAKDPEHRFASADALRVALDHVLAGVPIGQRDVRVQAAPPVTEPRPELPPTVAPPYSPPLPPAYSPPSPPLPPAPARYEPTSYPQPTAAGPTTPAPAPPRRAAWVVVAVALVALIALAVAAAVLRPWEATDPEASDDSSPSRSTGTETTPSTPTTPTEPTEPTESETTEVPDGPTVSPVTVTGTCGDGSCYLQVRTLPSATSDELTVEGTSVRWTDGSGHEVLCQVHGDLVSSSSVGGSSDVWAKTVDGGWVAAIHLTGIDSYNVETPC